MRNILEIYKVDLKLQRNISENIKKRFEKYPKKPESYKEIDPKT